MKHRPNSLAGKLLAFFTANPTEELTPAQIREKFGVTAFSVSMAVRRLEESGCENVRVIRLRSMGMARD